MGQHKSGREIKDWSLTVRLKKSVGKYLDGLATSLNWSRSRLVTELVLRFGEILIKDIKKSGISTYYGEGFDPPRETPPVTGEDEIS